MDIVRMNSDRWKAVCVSIARHSSGCVRTGMREIVPYREGLERLSKRGAVIRKNLVEIAHLAICAIGGVPVKLADNIVSEPLCHIQRPDNGAVFVVADAALKGNIGDEKPAAELMDIIVIGIGFVGFIGIGECIAIVNNAAIVSHDFYPRCGRFHEPCRHVGVISELDTVQEFMGAGCLKITDPLGFSDVIVDTGVNHEIGGDGQCSG